MPSMAAAISAQTERMNNGEDGNHTNVDLCGGTAGTGQIITMGNHTITIKRNDGVIQVLKLTDRTTIKTSTGKASESDLKVGDRVTFVVLDRDTASTVLECPYRIQQISQSI